MKQPLKEKLKAIGGMKLNEIQIEVEDIQDMEAAIFDIIIEFKKNFEKSEFKKSGHARKINSIIKQMLKLEAQLGNIVGDF
jgi:hypothetical protein